MYVWSLLAFISIVSAQQFYHTGFSSAFTLLLPQTHQPPFHMHWMMRSKTGKVAIPVLLKMAHKESREQFVWQFVIHISFVYLTDFIITDCSSFVYLVLYFDFSLSCSNELASFLRIQTEAENKHFCVLVVQLLYLIAKQSFWLNKVPQMRVHKRKIRCLKIWPFAFL